VIEGRANIVLSFGQYVRVREGGFNAEAQRAQRKRREDKHVISVK